MKPRDLIVPSLVAAPALLLHAVPRWAAWSEYRRTAIGDLELWRLVTGHWAHGSISHLAWDVLAFVALGVGLHALSHKAFWYALGGSVAAISSCLYIYASELEVYRGLSGIDTALFVALAGHLAIEGRRWMLPAGLVIALAKIVWEFTQNAAIFATEIPGHDVVPMAHLVGLVVGLLVVGDRWGDRIGAVRFPAGVAEHGAEF